MQWHRNNSVKIEGTGYLAVRKSDMNCNTLLELKEENQVRSIRYFHRTDTEKNYILFGCGKIGQEAVDYFGKDHVAYFVDNNAAMVGRNVYGKRVISFAEMKEIYRDYTLVITTKAEFAKEIMEQLTEEEIQDYWWFEEYEISQVSCWESGYRMLHH